MERNSYLDFVKPKAATQHDPSTHPLLCADLYCLGWCSRRPRTAPMIPSESPKLYRPPPGCRSGPGLGACACVCRPMCACVCAHTHGYPNRAAGWLHPREAEELAAMLLGARLWGPGREGASLSHAHRISVTDVTAPPTSRKSWAPNPTVRGFRNPKPGVAQSSQKLSAEQVAELASAPGPTSLELAVSVSALLCVVLDAPQHGCSSDTQE